MPSKPLSDLHASWWQRWRLNHHRDFHNSIIRFRRNGAAALLTSMVIGVTLALPAALHCLLRNVSTLSYSWESSLQVSLFLKDEVTLPQGEALAQTLRQQAGQSAIRYMSREQSLQEFRTLSGLGEGLSALDSNPMPAVITITPRKGISRPDLEAMLEPLKALREVEAVAFDQLWQERLYGFLDLIQRFVLVIAGVLSLAVLVVVGNTIRLDIEAKREEIEVVKLLGASDSFIRRPFLYTGFWFGFTGGLIAWLLVQLLAMAVYGPAQTLAALYNTEFTPAGLDLVASAVLFAAGIMLGITGAWWTVSRRLGEIEPR